MTLTYSEVLPYEALLSRLDTFEADGGSFDPRVTTQLYSGWAEQDVDEALNHLLAHPDRAKTSVVAQVVNSAAFAKPNPQENANFMERVTNLIESLPTLEFREAARQQISASLSSSNPEMAREVAQSISDPKLRSKRLQFPNSKTKCNGNIE